MNAASNTLVECNKENLDIVSIKKPNRMASIELARILCMVMVVFNHTFNQFYTVEGVGGVFAQYFNFFNICAVGVYFMITGFFLFDGAFAYRKKLKHLCTQILIPTAIVMLITMLSQAVAEYLKQVETNFWHSLRNAFLDLVKMLSSWNMRGAYTHLWFILSYIELIVFYPIYYLLCQENRIATIARRVLLGVYFIYAFTANLTWLLGDKWTLHTFTLIQNAAAYLLLGYELKRFYLQNRMQNRKKLSVIWGGGGTIILYRPSKWNAMLLFTKTFCRFRSFRMDGDK